MVVSELLVFSLSAETTGQILSASTRDEWSYAYVI